MNSISYDYFQLPPINNRMKFRSLSAVLAFSFVGSAFAVTTAPAQQLSFGAQTVTSSSGAGTLTSTFQQPLAAREYNYSYSTSYENGVDFRSVQTNPKPGVDGKIEIFKDTTIVTNTHSEKGFNDVAHYGVTGNANSFLAGQWISLSGSVTSSATTSVEFNLNASGKYQSTLIPGVGAVNPAMPSMFFSFDSASLGSLSTYTSIDATNSTYSTYAGLRSAFSAGQTKTFQAMLYIDKQVSLDRFDLDLIGDMYGFTSSDGSRTTVNSVSFKTVVIPALPVPEPETYAMLLAGLGLIGCIARRRNKTVASA